MKTICLPFRQPTLKNGQSLGKSRDLNLNNQSQYLFNAMEPCANSPWAKGGHRAPPPGPSMIGIIFFRRPYWMRIRLLTCDILG